ADLVGMSAAKRPQGHAQNITPKTFLQSKTHVSLLCFTYQKFDVRVCFSWVEENEGKILQCRR
ncbi:MAG: hypothetical protein RML38_12075, partial [Bacteroidia bacterium]|nr:hypothetical protein [Bacteroidia bacterium]